ncbi:MAG: hypothetical protein DMG45_01325 [Acidobacteria bacterium]|nr:MAG: hypothetical protein DMG45_01325 [Acidobacteriota bacterium]
MNHYEVLCIPVDADDGTIRSAFRRLARRYHPDVGTGSSREKFRELAEAYETLIDPLRRADYDRTLTTLDRPVPIQVEPLRAAPVAYSSRNFAASRGQLWHSPLESFKFIEELVRAIEDDFFFGWPRRR